MTEVLAGQKVLITRAHSQASIFKQKLEAIGALAVVLPVIEFKEPESWTQLDEAIEAIDSFDWIVFASTNSVNYFLERCKSKQLDLQKIAKLKLGAIGAKTKEELQKYGLTASYQPTKFIAEEFVHQFPEEMSGLKVLWPRTNIGRNLINEELTKGGADVTMVGAYRTELPDNYESVAVELFNLCNKKEVDIITVASSQTVRNLATLLKYGTVAYAKTQGFIVSPDSKALDTSIKGLLDGIAIASIGPVTTKTAKNYLGKVDTESSKHTIDGLIDSIVSYFRCQN